jgi:hypothetical protein
VARNLSLLQNVQMGFEAHLFSCPVGTGGPFSGDNQPLCEANLSPPFNAVVKNAWTCTSTSSYASMACTWTAVFSLYCLKCDYHHKFQDILIM